MLDAKSIRTWLLAAPKPDALRTTSSDGEVQDLALSKSGSWMAVAQTIEALRPELVEALDDKGVILRALRPLEQEASGSSSRSISAPRPAAVVLTDDPETRRFLAVAEIVKEAYRHATDVAFERMVDLFAAVNERSATLERSLDATHKMLKRAWEEQVEAQADAASARVEAEGDPLNNIVGAFLQGNAAAAHQQQQAAAPPPPAPTNGKANGARASNGKA